MPPHGRPTLPDVARAAGVSRSTAGRALGGYGPVSSQALARVKQAASDMGYEPDGLARSMVTGRTRTVGLVLADIQNPFFAAVTSGFVSAARIGGYDTVIVTTDEDPDIEDGGVAALRSRRVDGLAVASSHVVTPTWISSLTDHDSVLLLDRRPAAPHLDFVGVDNRRLSLLAVDHLLGLGHRRIALIAGATGREMSSGLMSTTVERIQGFRQGLAARGVSEDDTLVRVGDFHVEGAESQTARLLDDATPPTAIVGADAILTLGVLRAIRAAGLSCPHDLSVVSIDDSDWAPVVDPPLTSVRQPAREIGVTAARLLIERIADPSRRRRTKRLPLELVVRASTGRPPPSPPARRGDRLPRGSQSA